MKVYSNIYLGDNQDRIVSFLYKRLEKLQNNSEIRLEKLKNNSKKGWKNIF